MQVATHIWAMTTEDGVGGIGWIVGRNGGVSEAEGGYLGMSDLGQLKNWGGSKQTHC